MANDTITTKFAVDVSQFKRGISEANQQIKLANAQFKAATAGMDDWSKSAEGIQAKLKQLDSVISAQKSKLEAYKEQLARQQAAYTENGKRAEELRAKMQDLADNGVDKTSKEYKLLEQQLASVEKEQESNKKSVDSLKVSILDQEAAIGKSEKEYKNFESALDSVGDEEQSTEKDTKELGDETEKAGKAAEKSKDGFTVLKGALANLAADGIKAAVNGLKNLGKEFVQTIQDVATAGDEIDKQSQKIGLSAEAYQKWDYALSLSGASIQNLEGGMKSLNNAFDSAKNGSDSAAAKFERLGLSVADIADLSREDLFATVVEGLQNVTDDSEKAALATQLFGKAGQELIPMLNQDAEATKAMLQEAEDYGMVLSGDAVEAAANFSDSLTLVKGSLTGVKNNIVAEFLPAATSLIHGFAGIVAGVDGAEEELSEGATSFIQSFSGILPKLAKILVTIVDSVIQVAPQILSELIPALTDMIPKLLTTISDVFVPLVQAVISALGESLPVILPALLEVATDLVIKLADFFADNYDMLMDVMFKLLMALVDTIPKIIVKLAEALPKIIVKIVQFFVDNKDKILKAAFDLFMKLVEAAGQILGALGKALLEIVTKITTVLIEPVKNYFSNLWTDIKNIFKGVGEWFGAKFGEAWTKIKEKFAKFGEFFSGLWEGVKKTFSALGTKIGDAISGAVKSGINGVISQIERIINNAIGLINGAINLINKIPGVNLGAIPKLNIPRLAQGGVLEKGQLGLLEGSGAEAVVPLENNKRWIRAVAAQMQNEIGNTTNNEYTFTQNIYSPKPLSRIEIYRQTRNQFNFAKMKAGV